MKAQEDIIELKIRDIEEQLQVLRNEVELMKAKNKKSKKKPKTFADLRGIWKGKIHFTEEEINSAKIRVRDLSE